MKINKIISIIMLMILCSYPVNIYAMTKNETIYSTLKYNGQVEKTIINNELKNIEKGDITDYSKLDKIVNLNGNEKFSRDSQKITWKSIGKDIYYQGVLNESLPIQVDVKYYLDGKEMKPKDMIDKKGNVSIRIKFYNRDYNSIEGLYIPYVVDTTTMISNKSNSNFSITSGKSVSTGNNTVLTAISSPGLYENTRIDEFKDLDKVTITYDTKSFSAIDIYFAITPKLIDNIDLSKLDQVDNMVGSLGELQSGMDMIESGSSQLAEGNKQIAAKAKMLSSGIGQLSNGMNQLDSSLQEINNKITDITNTVNVINSILQAQQDNTIVITEEQYNMLPDSVKDALAQLVGLYQNNSDIMIRLKELDLSLSATYELYGLDRDEATIVAELQNNLDDKTISVLLNTKKLYETNYESNEELIERIKNYLHEILLGEQGIINTLVTYLNTINGYSIQLANGSSSINSGLSSIYDNSLLLCDALDKVSDSTSTLSNGISKINKEGINKLSELGNNVSNYSTKVKNIIKLTNEYNGYSGDNINQTIFIYKLNTK